MHKKALFIVSVLMVVDLALIVVRLSNPSHAFQEETSDKSRIKEIKTAEEIKPTENMTEQNYYLDLVSLEANDNTFEIVNNNFTIPEDLLTDLTNTIQGYKNGSSFLVVSLTDGMAFGYDIDTSYSSASTIKAAYALYLYKLAAAGKANLSDEVSNEAKFIIKKRE